jgi:murein DD-endopeptidase MepM/ murein hydrolase activator NlpD
MIAVPACGTSETPAPRSSGYVLHADRANDSVEEDDAIVDSASMPPGAPHAALEAAEGPTSKTPASRRTRPRFSWPLVGRVTSPFGPSRDRRHHPGIDIAGEAGTPILAASEGRVVRVANNPRYGPLVVIDHGRGFATWYRNATDPLVARGDRVSAGQQIALIGESGSARRTHLHFELRRRGQPVDPLPFLQGAMGSNSPAAQ